MQKFSRNILVPETTADFTSRISKSHVPFTCKFPMVMHFVPILPRWCRFKTNFYVFSYDKTSLKFCASFRFFLAVFMEKFQKIHYLNYVRRGIGNVYATILYKKIASMKTYIQLIHSHFDSILCTNRYNIEHIQKSKFSKKEFLWSLEILSCCKWISD